MCRSQTSGRHPWCFKRWWIGSKQTWVCAGGWTGVDVSADDSKWDILLMLNHSTLNHSYHATHMTIQGYNSTGFLQFTCHLREDLAFDQAWIYRVGRGQTDVRTNEKVKMKMLQGLKKNFCTLELEWVTGILLRTISLTCDLMYSIAEVPESKTTIDSLELEPVPGMVVSPHPGDISPCSIWLWQYPSKSSCHRLTRFHIIYLK